MFGGFSAMMTVSGRRFCLVQQGVWAVRAPWQPSFGAAEDRNAFGGQPLFHALAWQPSFGAAEDRNESLPRRTLASVKVAAVLRGG